MEKTLTAFSSTGNNDEVSEAVSLVLRWYSV